MTVGKGFEIKNNLKFSTSYLKIAFLKYNIHKEVNR